MRPGKLRFLAMVLIIASIAYLNRYWWNDYQPEPPYQFVQDVNYYYAYLPGLFIHKDLYFHHIDNPYMWLLQGEGDKRLPKFTFGMSFMYMPFFLIGHAFAIMLDYDVTGYTKPYSIAVRMGSLFYFLLGIFFLMKLLDRYFRKYVVFLVLISLTWASNLLYYVLGNSDTPHLYLFALFSISMFVSDEAFNRDKVKLLPLLAALSGLIVLIRNSELLFIPILWFWGVNRFSAIRTRLRFLFSRPLNLILYALIFALPMIIQMIYWKGATGSYVFDFYQGQKFFFNDPKILDFLFSYRKGMFVYCPLMLFAFAGMFMLRRYDGFLGAIIFPWTAVVVYVLSSWWIWWYGGGLGMRAMVQYYALLSFPLAAFITWMLRYRILKMAGFLSLIFLVYFNSLLMVQQKSNMIHYDSMTKESFWFMFMKESYSPEEWAVHESLLQHPDVEKAMKGEDR